uniref:Dedicator of cytokinesis protein 9 n=1 Tax=Ciona savignyi TaxID=51511 RepID=H2Y9C6_CIOSA
EPVEYEAYIIKRQSEIQHDTLRSLLTFPEDDIVSTVKARDRRTTIDTVPPEASKEASGLFVKECIKTYTSNWSLIEPKYEQYASDYLHLPKGDGSAPPSLTEQVFEVDEEPDYEDDVSGTQKEGVTKLGWLYKAPAYGVSGLSIRSFKRRFFHLKQLPDNSYILNFYKDEKINKDPKGAIYLDSCIGAHVTTKARKYAFEVRMQDQSSHMLAAETESEANEWIATINLALQSSIEAQVTQNAKLGKFMDFSLYKLLKKWLNTFSMHPELVKYARETDQKNTLARKEGRQNLLKLFPDFQDRYANKVSGEIEPPSVLKSSRHRIMVGCKNISFTLRGVVIDGADEPVTNVEPFFVTIALYDIKMMKKISADLHVDLNHPLVRRMIPKRAPSNTKRSSVISEEERTGEPTLQIVDKEWIAYPKKGIFSVTNPHNDIYLVARIEKVLQGSIKACAQPYMKSDSDNHKTAAKVLKHAKPACQRLGQYRMPFAWTAKPLFDNTHGHINTNGFEYVYKQESNKLAQEDLLKFLCDFKRPEKLAKLEIIECELQIGIHSVPTDLPNILTSSYIPVKPYAPTSSPSNQSMTTPEPVLEVDEFLSSSPSEQHINMELTNHCYIYPKSLNYDNQKTFQKARNIAVVAEFRDSDSDGSKALQSFYRAPGRPGNGPYSSLASAAVLHHVERPEFYDEWKLALPTQLHHGHHILFSFHHVVVDTNTKKKESTQLDVGYAWLPLLTKEGRLNCGDHPIPVAGVLQPGYLSLTDQLALGKMHGEVKWVDGGKNLFRVGLNLVSTIYTDDKFIHNFFESCQRLSTSTSEQSIDLNAIKSLAAADRSELVHYLPTILNQLLYLLTVEGITGDSHTTTIKCLIDIIDIYHFAEHDKVIQQYIKYMFVTAPWKDYKSKTIHEELATVAQAMLRPSATDFLTANKLLLHSSFIFQIILKSMAQHLIQAKKLKQNRSERFPLSFQHAVQSLLTTTTTQIVGKWKSKYSEVHNANVSLAHFVKSCFTYLDRGFVFKLVKYYVEHFNPGDPKVLFELKFEFLRIVCYHEHYIPLNLPFACNSKSARNSKSYYSYCLSEDYCRIHFLVGLLLKSLCSALYEPPDIRSIAIETFRNILAKHVFDDRYQGRQHQSRITTLYLPFLRILLDNVGRMSVDTEPSVKNTLPLLAPSSLFLPSEIELAVFAQGCLIPRFCHLFKDVIHCVTSRVVPPEYSFNSSSLLVRGSRGSVAVSESNNTNAQSNNDRPQDKLEAQTMSMASATRFSPNEQFDATEIRNLLLCFLHIVNHLPADALHGFWKDSTTEEQIEFFEVQEMCLHHFRYTGKKH